MVVFFFLLSFYLPFLGYCVDSHIFVLLHTKIKAPETYSNLGERLRRIKEN